jgi:hypothetical protein
MQKITFLNNLTENNNILISYLGNDNNKDEINNDLEKNGFLLFSENQTEILYQKGKNIFKLDFNKLKNSFSFSRV